MPHVASHQTAGARPRLLMLTHRFPYPPNRGDRIRSYHLLRTLSKHYDVALASTTDEVVPVDDFEHVQSQCESVAIASLGRYRRLVAAAGSFAAGGSLTVGMFTSASLRRQIVHWHDERPFDGVLVFCSSMFPYVDQPAFAGVQRVVDLVDVDSQKWSQMSRETTWPMNWVYRFESKRVQRLEQRIADSATATVLVSNREADVFRSSVRVSNPVIGICNGVDTNYFHPNSTVLLAPRPSQLANLSLVFTGVLDYHPNVEGIIWFCRQVLPQLQCQVKVRLLIVGRRPCGRVLELGAIRGVEIVGEVPDVRPYLREADIAISPLHLARGIQNKVLEAMASALPVVVSPESAEGIEANSGSEIMIAESASQWCETLLQLAKDPASRQRIGAAARDLVVSRYSWAARLQPFVELFRSPNDTWLEPSSRSRVGAS